MNKRDKARECPVSLSGKHSYTLITTDTWRKPYKACGYCGKHQDKDDEQER